MLLVIFASCSDPDFNSGKWKKWNEEESDIHLRWDMVNDLINSYELEGKTIFEIEKLLGEFKDECPNGNCTIQYNLGPCRTGIDYGSLIIQFKLGRVTRIEKECS